MTSRTWTLAHNSEIALGPNARIMAIINVTPDSFSGDGLHREVDAAVAQSMAAIEQGAHIVDIGGESTRPGAEQVTADEECTRILPVIEALRQQSDVLISVDTYRAETARLAVAAGANIINDISGLSGDPEMAAFAAASGAGLVIMHTGRGRMKLPDVVEDQYAFLGAALKDALAAGVRPGQIMLDPGFGFAKDAAENIELMTRFPELLGFGYPLLAGTSRKRFIGEMSGRPPQERDIATAATSIALRLAGADVFRVHNVAINRDALSVADAMLADRNRRERRD